MLMFALIPVICLKDIFLKHAYCQNIYFLIHHCNFNFQILIANHYLQSSNHSNEYFLEQL